MSDNLSSQELPALDVKGVIHETRVIGCIIALMLFSPAEVQAQGYLDGLMGRATESAKRKAQDRVKQNIDQSIDKAIKKTEDTVKCVATTGSASGVQKKKVSRSRWLKCRMPRTP